jgi:hypothetical protein
MKTFLANGELMDTDICIVSGGTRLRLPSPINHKIYAEIHGADYRLECGPVGALKNPYYFKLKTLVRILPRYDWVLWIDDDAFFTDFAVKLREFCRSRPEEVLLTLADGRVRSAGAWTRINSGVILVRRRPEALIFLERCLDTDINAVRVWWAPQEHGMFTNSDQDTLLYRMLEYPDQRAFEIVPHLNLNAREYHYSDRLSEHFICHFPGLRDKISSVRNFGKRFGVDTTLVPVSVTRAHGCEEGMGEELVMPPKRGFLERVQRRMRGTISALVSR